MADDYLDLTPKDDVIDLFPTLAGPIAAKMLAEILGIPDASEEELQRWSQALIDGAGNFGYFDEPFARAKQENIEINACMQSNEERLCAIPDPSTLSVMINMMSQSNILRLLRTSKSQSVVRSTNLALRFLRYYVLYR